MEDNEACQCGESMDRYDFLEAKLMHMTYWAHQQLLMEKLKEKIEKEEGTKLDKLADLLLQTSKTEMEEAKVTDKKREELRNRIKDYFN